MRIVTLGWFIKAKKLLEGGGKPPPPAPTIGKMGPPVAEMPEAPAAPTELKVYPKGDIAKMLMADMKKTGMDQARITALDRTIHSGRIHHDASRKTPVNASCIDLDRLTSAP